MCCCCDNRATLATRSCDPAGGLEGNPDWAPRFGATVLGAMFCTRNGSERLGPDSKQRTGPTPHFVVLEGPLHHDSTRFKA